MLKTVRAQYPAGAGHRMPVPRRVLNVGEKFKTGLHPKFRTVRARSVPLHHRPQGVGRGRLDPAFDRDATPRPKVQARRCRQRDVTGAPIEHKRPTHLTVGVTKCANRVPLLVPIMSLALPSPGHQPPNPMALDHKRPALPSISHWNSEPNQEVGHQHRVIARLTELHIGQRQRRIRRSNHVRPDETPLVENGLLPMADHR